MRCCVSFCRLRIACRIAKNDKQIATGGRRSLDRTPRRSWLAKYLQLQAKALARLKNESLEIYSDLESSSWRPIHLHSPSATLRQVALDAVSHQLYEVACGRRADSLDQALNIFPLCIHVSRFVASNRGAVDCRPSLVAPATTRLWYFAVVLWALPALRAIRRLGDNS